MEDLFAGTQISRFQFLPHLNARPRPAGRRKTNEETEIPLEPPLKTVAKPSPQSAFCGGEEHPG